MYLDLESTINAVVERLLPRNLNSSMNKMVLVSIRLSKNYYLAESPDEVFPEIDVLKIRSEVLESGLPIYFDGWKFEVDFTTNLAFVIGAGGGSYSCFHHDANFQNKLSKNVSECTGQKAACHINLSDVPHLKDSSNCVNGLNSSNWVFTTSHDSCWRDNAYMHMKKLNNACTQFVSKILEDCGIKNNASPCPTFTAIENLGVADISSITEYNGIDQHMKNFMFYNSIGSGLCSKVIIVDLTSSRFIANLEKTVHGVVTDYDDMTFNKVNELLSQVTHRKLGEVIEKTLEEIRS